MTPTQRCFRHIVHHWKSLSLCGHWGSARPWWQAVSLQTANHLKKYVYNLSAFAMCLLAVKWSEVNLQPTGSHLEPITRFLFSVWRLRVSWCVAPSLTRGRVCNLLVQLLLGLARAVTLGSKSRRTHGHILLPHLRLPQPGGPGPCIYIPQEQGGPVIPPGAHIIARTYEATREQSNVKCVTVYRGTSIRKLPRLSQDIRYGDVAARHAAASQNPCNILFSLPVPLARGSSFHMALEIKSAASERQKFHSQFSSTFVISQHIKCKISRHLFNYFHATENISRVHSMMSSQILGDQWRKDYRR
jgi:hypothetical protein